MRLTKQQLKDVQHALNYRGFGPLVVDGIFGKVTKLAIVQFKKSIGYNPRPLVGPLTFKALMSGLVKYRKPTVTVSDIPWINEALSVLGLNERSDFTELSKYLISDGTTVGDIREIPWCGDLVETCIKRALPDAVTPKNPYLALNWNKWGEPCAPCVGAIVVFWRGSPDSWKGHVGFIVGESKTNWYVLGGNQKNSVTITPISKKRVRKNGIRFPSPKWTDVRPGKKPPKMSGGTVTTNEQ